MISHVERFVCPSITSDQILGDTPFRFREDKRAGNPGDMLATPNRPPRVDFEKQWTLVSIPNDWSKLTNGSVAQHRSAAWVRCTVRFPKIELASSRWLLQVSGRPESVSAWLNGQPMIPISTGKLTTNQSFEVPSEAIYDNEANLLVLRIDNQETDALADPPALTSGATKLELKGRWQLRLGDDQSWSNIPLPAKFGMPPDVYYELLNRN